MVSCSIFASKEEVFKGLESFLLERNYKKIKVNRPGYGITAERRDSFFSKKYAVKFAVLAKTGSVADIEITVNPHHAVPEAFDIKQEDKIRSRIYFYF